MSTEGKAANKAAEVKGKAKKLVGEATDDPELEAEGRVDEAKANLKQAVEKLMDAVKGAGK